jgi:hypothetical protein
MLLAIDPGPVQSAYVVWTGKPVRFGLIPNEAMYRELGALEGDTDIVIEMVASYGMPVGREVFETCVWIGRFLREAERYFPTSRIHRLTRHEVKMALCHSARANDANIRQALIDRYGPPGTKLRPGLLYGVVHDIWAALALAVAYSDITNAIAAGEALKARSERSKGIA